MTAEPRIVHLHIDLGSGDAAADPAAQQQILDIVTQIQATLGSVEQRGITMSKELDDLKAAVTRSATVQSGAAALLKGLSEQITANADDPAELEALATSLNDQADEWGKAVAASTPGHPTDPNNPGAPLSQQIPDPNNPPLDPATDAPVVITDPNAETGVPADTPQVPLPNTTDATVPADESVPTDTTTPPDTTAPADGVNTEGTPA